MTGYYYIGDRKVTELEWTEYFFPGTAVAKVKTRSQRIGRPREYEDQTAEILRLVAEGWSQRQVAEKLGVPKSTVGRIVKDRA